MAITKYIRPNNITAGTLQLTGLLALIGALFSGVSIWWWVAAYCAHIVYYCIGESAGQHRYFAHRAYRVNKFWHYVLLFLCTVGSNNSPNFYRAVHIKHHRFSDAEGDPHWFKKFGYKMLVMFTLSNYRITAREFLKQTNKETRFVFDNFYLFHLGWAIFLLLFGWKALVFLYLIPFFTGTIAMTSALTFQHSTGYQNFDTGDDSKNVWWLWPISFGEAWHNNHHRKPNSKTTKVKWWELDPAYWFIRLVEKK